MSLSIASTRDNPLQVALQQLRQVESKLRDLIEKHGTVCVGLLDSENIPPVEAARVASKAENCGAKAILVGGSTAVDQLEL